jgi:hypothetical protein
MDLSLEDRILGIICRSSFIRHVAMDAVGCDEWVAAYHVGPATKSLEFQNVERLLRLRFSMPDRPASTLLQDGGQAAARESIPRTKRPNGMHQE